MRPDFPDCLIYMRTANDQAVYVYEMKQGIEVTNRLSCKHWGKDKS